MYFDRFDLEEVVPGKWYVSPRDKDTGAEWNIDKDESGQWWAWCAHIDGERGPFNSIDHACDCLSH